MKRTRAMLIAPERFELIEEEIPPLREDEVLYKTISVGLCHSDIPAYHGTSAMGFGNKHGYDAMIKTRLSQWASGMSRYASWRMWAKT